MQDADTSEERGVFIVLEGTDRSGKTLQCQNIYEYLVSKGRKCVKMNFPANRWELNDQIKKNLEDGIDVICDRYSFSGIAYSSGAVNLDFEWCKSREEGLVSPDAVIFLDVNLGLSSGRSGFGDEIYENMQDQRNVYKVYQMFSSYSFWHNVNASQDPDAVFNEIVPLIEKTIQETKPISCLWEES